MKTTRLLLLLIGWALLSSTVLVNRCEAATFWDWLWGRTPYYQPFAHRAYMPTTAPATTAPVISIPGATTIDPCHSIGGTTLGAPITAPITAPLATPVAGWGAPAMSDWRQPAGIFPSNFYHGSYYSTYQRVPVTSYRPVQVVDPLSGATVSQLQPCNSFEYQVRRVPTRRSLFPWLHGQRAPSLAAPLTVAPTNCGTCSTPTFSGSTMTVPSQPYYAPPASSTISPIPSMTPNAPPTSGGSAPADRPPTLRSGEGASNAMVPQMPSTMPQSARPVLPGMGPRPTVPQRRTETQQAASDVVPLPDPQRRSTDNLTEEAGPMIDVPHLLDPQNHTARAQRDWSIAPIGWPQHEASMPTSSPQEDGGLMLHDPRGQRIDATPSSATPSFAAPSSAAPSFAAPSKFDDGGWAGVAN